jgi:hypothetical protein
MPVRSRFHMRSSMRITRGRTLRPSNLAERRLLLSSLGTNAIRVPRSVNPYVLARRLERAAKGHPDVSFVSDIIKCARIPKCASAPELPNPPGSHVPSSNGT